MLPHPSHCSPLVRTPPVPLLTCPRSTLPRSSYTSPPHPTQLPLIRHPTHSSPPLPDTPRYSPCHASTLLHPLPHSSPFPSLIPTRFVLRFILPYVGSPQLPNIRSHCRSAPLHATPRHSTPLHSFLPLIPPLLLLTPPHSTPVPPQLNPSAPAPHSHPFVPNPPSPHSSPLPIPLRHPSHSTPPLPTPPTSSAFIALQSIAVHSVA